MLGVKAILEPATHQRSEDIVADDDDPVASKGFTVLTCKARGCRCPCGDEIGATSRVIEMADSCALSKSSRRCSKAGGPGAPLSSAKCLQISGAHEEQFFN